MATCPCQRSRWERFAAWQGSPEALAWQLALVIIWFGIGFAAGRLL